MLTPIHERGNITPPSNYRGIAISSNMSKLFCSVLHNRLFTFSDAHNLLPDCQIGYRSKFRTTGHILTLKSVITYLSKKIHKYIKKCTKKRLFCCFVDFKAAFDSISRMSLLYKLLKMDIGGNFLLVLRHMYESVTYAIKTRKGISDDFPSIRGVKQGCILSPLLFNLFVADLPDIFTENCDPVVIHDRPLSCLMFADDLVLLSETAHGLQNSLTNLGNYCDQWGLDVNLDKTKIISSTSSEKL